MRTIFSSLGAIFALCLPSSVELGQQPSSEARSRGFIEYRILEVKLPQAENYLDLGYTISIKRRLANKEEFEKLICQLVEQEKVPQDCDSLNVGIYHGLETLPASESAVAKENILGHYSWGPKLMGNQYALAIYRDKGGERFSDGPKFFAFDHAFDCNK